MSLECKTLKYVLYSLYFVGLVTTPRIIKYNQ